MSRTGGSRDSSRIARSRRPTSQSHGVPELLGDVIDMPIGRDRYIREKQAVRKKETGGKPAITKYEVDGEVVATCRRWSCGNRRSRRIQKLPPPPPKFSLIKLTPKTGRTHQLRVHLSAIGHPIVGDTMYGGRPFTHGEFHFERQALHAFQITFVHPATLETMTLEAPLPPDMTRLLEIGARIVTHVRRKRMAE